MEHFEITKDVVNKIMVTYLDGHCVEFDNILSYNNHDGFLIITREWDLPNVIATNTAKINLNNIVGYTVCVCKNKEESTNV